MSGEIHHIGYSTSASLWSSDNPTIVRGTTDNILYTSASHLGVGYTGEATGGSTTTLVDSSVDFTALGVGTTYGINKVYNTTTGEEYEITNVTATTLTFATATTGASDGDVYIAFVDTKFDFGLGTHISGSDAHFLGQDSPGKWKRSFIKTQDKYFITNGNFLSSLDLDETNWDEEVKQLPPNHHATSMAENSGKIAVTCDYRGQGKLLLWDQTSSGWNNIISVNGTPYNVESYKNGFIFQVRNRIYYTDGYQVQLITKILDIDDDSTTNFYLKLIDDRLYVSISGSVSFSRLKSGIYIYDFNTGWEYYPLEDKDGDHNYTGRPGEIIEVSSSQSNSDYNKRIVFNGTATSEYSICKMLTSPGNEYGATFYLELPQKQKINGIELHLGHYSAKNYAESDSTVTVTVNYGDGKKPANKYSQTDTTNCTTTYIENGYASGIIGYAEVGDLLVMYEGPLAGERTYITEVVNTGDYEGYNVSPALSAAPDDSDYFKWYSMKKAASKTLTGKIPSELLFPVNSFYSDKLFFEVRFTDTNMDLNINSINIY